MFADTVGHLPAHLHNLCGQSQPVVSLHKLGYKGIAGLHTLLAHRTFVDARGTVGGVDLTAEEYGHGDLAAHETETAILQLVSPVESRHRTQRLLQQACQLLADYSRLHTRRDKVACGRTDRLLERVGIQRNVVTHINVCAHGVYLGHTQTYGRLTLAFGRHGLIFGRLDCRILRCGNLDGLLQR